SQSETAELPRKILKARRLRATKQIVLGIGFPLFLLLLWEMAARLGMIDQRFFPAPSRVAAGMVALLSDPGERERLLFDIGATYHRLALGYVIGSVLGVVTGVAMGLSTNARFALGPLVNATF